MAQHVSDLILAAAGSDAAAVALRYRDKTLNYGDLAQQVEQVSRALVELGLGRGERVAVYLEKRFETVLTIFGAPGAGGAFVPINPQLKARQVTHILSDCNVRILVTARARLAGLAESLAACPDLRAVVLVDGKPEDDRAAGAGPQVLSWAALAALGAASTRQPWRVIESDMAAILYTSGSTGLPKGVVLSHRNLLAGAESVSSYLENAPSDRILSVLPLSFDAGLSQLTTAFAVGARVVLLNYLLPRDVARCCAAEGVTGLTCVPPLWIQLTQVEWPAEAAQSLRYFANTGGHMPKATLDRLRKIFPVAKPYLMYGLTEAFRSSYLDPAEVDRRPDSMGKAVPNAEIMVVRPDGSLCDADEPGELVHRGPFVALGYWNDPERTAQRFRPAPGRPAGLTMNETAVWSGDRVRRDAEGFLYFIGRADEMIKTSGYRVSPTEVEEVLYATGLVGEAVALGIPHAGLGQAIVIAATPPEGGLLDIDALLAHCRGELPNFMVPQRVVPFDSLPRNANGKIDRRQLAEQLSNLFEEVTS